MKRNRLRQPLGSVVLVAGNLGACKSEVVSSAGGWSSEESKGMLERSASISWRRRAKSISFSRNSSLTSFTTHLQPQTGNRYQHGFPQARIISHTLDSWARSH